MTRSEIISRFRQENPEITARVITTTVLNSWLLTGDKEFCAEVRCIVNTGETISTSENDQSFVLTTEIDKFFDVDTFPGGGVLYNGKRLEKTTMGLLDEESENWRARASGTPKKWYRRGDTLYLDRPIDSNEYDLTVYAVLISDDWDSDVAPFNELTYLSPFHYGMVLYLTKRAKAKIGKGKGALAAAAEYFAYTKWAKGQLGGNKYDKILFQPKAGMYYNQGFRRRR